MLIGYFGDLSSFMAQCLSFLSFEVSWFAYFFRTPCFPQNLYAGISAY